MTDQVDKATDDDRQMAVQEWGRTRDTMATFDEKLHDLRKYGFSLITVFLAADGLLLKKLGDITSDPLAKFGVLIVTLFLILALQLLDKNYTVFQEAADTRSVVLERRLNIELSDVITQRCRSEHVRSKCQALYTIFTISIILIG